MQLFALIERLAARGVAIVYITHRLDEVFRIGQAQTGLTSMIGTMDEVAVYKRALSAEEVQSDMEKGVISAVSPQDSLATTWGNIRSR